MQFHWLYSRAQAKWSKVFQTFPLPSDDTASCHVLGVNGLVVNVRDDENTRRKTENGRHVRSDLRKLKDTYNVICVESEQNPSL